MVSLRALWWAPVFVALHDCVASLHWVSSKNEGGGTEGEVVVVDRLKPRLYKFRRGETVLLWSPEEPHRLLLRRLIGLEGDWVTVPGETKVQKIPKGQCWVESDPEGRRSSSSSSSGGSGSGGDSRTFGAVPLALIQGSVAYRCWPLSRWGAVEARLPPGRVIAMGSFATAALDEETW